MSISSGGDNRLQIMTMHKAKGLQFDHVVLPSLGRYAKSTGPSVLSWTNMPTEHGMDVLLSPVGRRNDLERDRLHRFIETAQRRRERLELDRLLYVACTRAKRSLHLVAHVDRDRTGEIKTPHRASLLYRLWPALEQEIVARAAATDRTPARAKSNQTRDRWLEPRLRRVSEPWVPAPVDAAPGTVGLEKRLPAADRTVPYRWVGAVARHAGIVIHQWLEQFARAGTRPAANALEHTRAQTRTWATAAGVLDEHLDDVCRQVERGLEGILNDPRGVWILEGGGHAELPLTGISGGRLASVVIDRIRIDDNVHWVIDYKTGSHEGGSLATFLSEETERYTPQLRLYADLYAAYAPDVDVRTALYFPLLREFVEVDVVR